MENNSPVSGERLMVKGAVILSAGAAATKILSAVYRIPFQNIVGDIGFYIYQQVYPFYGIAVAMASAGFPVIVSKLYAERPSENVLFRAFLALFPLCFSLFLFLFFGADWIAKKMGDGNLAPLIAAVAFPFLFVPFISLFRGYFQGMGNMVPTAVSQVAEQTVRVGGILAAAALFANGKNLYAVGEGAAVASAAGSLVCFLFLLFCFSRRKKGRKNRPEPAASGDGVRPGTVLLHGLAATVCGMVPVIFQLIDNFQILPSLLAKGTDFDAARAMKGVFDRGQPLVQIGIILSVSVSSALVPIMAKMRSRGREEEADKLARLAVQFSIAAGAAASVGLIMIMEPLNIMLFTNSAGTLPLRILALTVVFLAANMAVTAVFQGMGNPLLPFYGVLAGIVAKIVFNAAFIRAFGIPGAALASNLALAAMSAFFFAALKKRIKEDLFPKDFIFVLFRSLAAMAALVGALNALCGWLLPDSPVRLFSAFQSLFASFFGAFVFCFVLARGKIFTKSEWLLVPFGEKLLRFLPKTDRGDSC